MGVKVGVTVCKRGHSELQCFNMGGYDAAYTNNIYSQYHFIGIIISTGDVENQALSCVSGVGDCSDYRGGQDV